MNYGGNAQKVSFIFNPKQGFNLIYSSTANTSGSFIVTQTITTLSA